MSWNIFVLFVIFVDRMILGLHQ